MAIDGDSVVDLAAGALWLVACGCFSGFIRTAFAAEHLLQWVPIDRDQFENGSGLGDPPTSVRIVRFLSEQVDSAYRRGEIADAIEVSPETVGPNLTRLKDRGLVRHRVPYWAVTEDRDRVRSFLRDRVDSGGDGRRRTAVEQANDQATTPNENTHSQHDGDETPATGTQDSVNGMDSQQHRKAATAFFDRVDDLFDGAIEARYLFGSVARATETAESDVDILAVIANDADYATIDDQLLDIAYNVQLEWGIRVWVHSMRAAEFTARKARGDPFIQRIVEGGEDDSGGVPEVSVEREFERAEQMLSDARAAHAVEISKATIIDRLSDACVHAAHAVLYARGHNPQSHGQVQTVFGEELVETGEVPRDTGRFLNDMETYRRRVDDGAGGVERDTDELLDQTSGFLATMRRLMDRDATTD